MVTSFQKKFTIEYNELQDKAKSDRIIRSDLYYIQLCSARYTLTRPWIAFAVSSAVQSPAKYFPASSCTIAVIFVSSRELACRLSR